MNFDDQRIHIHTHTHRRDKITDGQILIIRKLKEIEKKEKNKDHNQISYKSFLEVRNNIFSLVTE